MAGKKETVIGRIASVNNSNISANSTSLCISFIYEYSNRCFGNKEAVKLHFGLNHSSLGLIIIVICDIWIHQKVKRLSIELNLQLITWFSTKVLKF
jgi:hypothetical protein